MKPLVWTGLLSYSLYLWHWPFVSFKKHLVVGDDPLVTAAFFVVSVLFALGSHLLIENPFRFTLRSNAKVLAFTGSGSTAAIALAGLGFAGWLAKPVTARELAWRQDVDWHGREFRGANIPIVVQGDALGSAGIDFVLWGDSQAGMLSGIVDQLGKERGLRGRAFITDGSIPISGHSQEFSGKRNFHDQSFDQIVALHPSFCLLCSSWKAYIKDVEQTVDLFGLMADRLNSEGIRVFVLRQFPQGGYAREHLIRERFPEWNPVISSGISRDEFLRSRTLENEFVSSLRSRCSGVAILDPDQVIFSGEEGDRVPLVSSGRSHFRDPGHLSWFGASLYGKRMLQSLFEASSSLKNSADLSNR